MKMLVASALAVAVSLACQPPSADAPTKDPAGDKPGAKPANGAENPGMKPASKPDDIPAPPDVAAAPADATKTPSGLAYKVQSPGKGGDKPTADDTVEVHYTGWLTDGKKFDSSVDRGRPFSFRLGQGQVIKGWDEGVAGMKPGGKRKLFVPAKLGYRDQAKGNIPPNSDLVFEVELLEILP